MKRLWRWLKVRNYIADPFFVWRGSEPPDRWNHEEYGR